MRKVKLGDFVTVTNEREDNPSQSRYERFVGLEHYDSGSVTISRWGTTEMLVSAMKVFHKGDILVARRNVYLKRASVVDFDGITSGDSIILHVNDERYRSIIPYVLNTDSFWDYADQHSDGSMSKRLAPQTMLEYEFILHEDGEIENLATLLWCMERTKTAYKNLIIKTDELVKSQFIEMFGDPEKNPMNWPVKQFTDVAAVDGNMTTDYEKYANYPHIGIDSIEKDTGVLSGYRTVKEDNVISGKYVFGPQHILYSKIRPALNKVALPDFEGLCSADCYPILPDEIVCRRKFLAHVMRSDYFLKYVLAFSARSQMPKVNRQQISGFQFPCPPVEAQDEFVAFMEQSDKSKFAAKQALEDLTAAQKALMRQYLG